MPAIHSTLRHVHVRTPGSSRPSSPCDGRSGSTNELIHAAIQRLEIWSASAGSGDTTTPPQSSPPSPVIDGGKDVAKAVAKEWMEKQFGSSGSGFAGTSKNDANVETMKGSIIAPTPEEKENTSAGGKSTEARQLSPVLLARRPAADSARLLDILNGGAARAHTTAVVDVHDHHSNPPSNWFNANANSNADYHCAPGTWLAEEPRLALGLPQHGNPNAPPGILNAGCAGIAPAGNCAYAYHAEAGRADVFVDDPFATAEDDDEVDKLEWPDTIGFLGLDADEDDGEPLPWPPVIENVAPPCQSVTRHGSIEGGRGAEYEQRYEQQGPAANSSLKPADKNEPERRYYRYHPAPVASRYHHVNWTAGNPEDVAWHDDRSYVLSEGEKSMDISASNYTTEESEEDEGEKTMDIEEDEEEFVRDVAVDS